MLTPETPFPHPGSYALLNDPDLPFPQPTELVRVMWRRVDDDQRGFVAVSFPLRAGASGNKVVPADSLVDGTPLTAAEALEFHDLDRSLFGRTIRTKRQKARAARHDALKARVIFAPMLERLLRTARARANQQRQAA